MVSLPAAFLVVSAGVCALIVREKNRIANSVIALLSCV
jgi:hypothetical protein